MIVLTNPLTTEERLSLTRLIGHDLLNDLDTIVLSVENSLRLGQPVKQYVVNNSLAVGSFAFTISNLSQRDALRLGSWDILTKEKATDLFNRISLKKHNSSDPNINIELEGFQSLIANSSILYSLFSNLSKNARRACPLKQHPNRNITISCSYHEDFPEQATFIPEGARDYNRFLAFKVHDNGKGFPQDKNWRDYFTICPPKGEHGFGLYFTGLAAKVLRAPIEIKSVPGDTTLSFYHPIYPNTD